MQFKVPDFPFKAGIENSANNHVLNDDDADEATTGQKHQWSASDTLLASAIMKVFRCGSRLDFTTH